MVCLEKRFDLDVQKKSFSQATVRQELGSADYLPTYLHTGARQTHVEEWDESDAQL